MTKRSNHRPGDITPSSAGGTRTAGGSGSHAFSDRYLIERELRPKTIKGYRSLLATRILPMFGPTPLTQVTLADIEIWLASLDPGTEATNAAAYRLFPGHRRGAPAHRA